MKKRKSAEELVDKSLIDINERMLDAEWLRQPRLYMKYALELADAKARHAERKAGLDTCRAEIDLDIRLKPKEYNIEKVTESTIASSILMQPEYKQAMERLIVAKHRVDILEAVCVALDHRKKALENLVFLHGQNYFSKPRVEGGDEIGKKRARRMQED
jgi:hypothetical protein